MVLLILRNISFEHDLPIVDDHVASMQIASPHLYARVVQSFLALEAGEESLEPFLFLQDDDLLDTSKLLYVVTDPFHIDFANKKIMTALYGEINQLIRKNPLWQARWEKHMVEMSDFIQEVTREIPLEISAPDEMTVQDVCKAFGVQLDCPLNTSPLVRICKLLDVLAEWMPKKLLILCNLDNYFSDADWQELIKYAAYTKVKTMLIFQNQAIPMHEQEIRWQIDQNYDDKIIKL